MKKKEEKDDKVKDLVKQLKAAGAKVEAQSVKTTLPAKKTTKKTAVKATASKAKKTGSKIVSKVADEIKQVEYSAWIKWVKVIDWNKKVKPPKPLW